MPLTALSPSHSRLGSALRSRTYPHRGHIVIRQSPLPVPIDFSSLSSSWTRHHENSTTNVVASSEKHVIYVVAAKYDAISSISRQVHAQYVKSRGWNVGKSRHGSEIAHQWEIPGYGANSGCIDRNGRVIEEVRSYPDILSRREKVKIRIRNPEP